jgi:hypothetical protein
VDQIHFALFQVPKTLSVLIRAEVLNQIKKREVSLFPSETFISILKISKKLNVEARLDAFFLYFKKSLEGLILPH